jgi:hypothetical protein
MLVLEVLPAMMLKQDGTYSKHEVAPHRFLLSA